MSKAAVTLIKHSGITIFLYFTINVWYYRDNFNGDLSMNEHSQAMFYVFGSEPSVSQKRMIQIVEGAITTFSKYGIDRATYDQIAKACGVSRPLIQHYFPSKKALVESSFKYTRFQFKEIISSAVAKGLDANQKLEYYVRCHFEYLNSYDSIFKVWMLFFHYCSSDKRLQEISAEVVKYGWERIIALINFGIASKQFDVVDVKETARLIQIIITGALISLGTERGSVQDPKELEEQTIRACFALVSPTA